MRTPPPSDAALPGDPRLAAARERAFRVLTDRYADDSLTVEQFEARLDAVYRAPDAVAIERLVGDLHEPAPVVPAAAAAWPTAAGSADAPAWTAPREEGRLLAVMSETRREGAWQVPRRLRLIAVMSEVVLDLRDAALPPGCTLDVVAVMAEVKILVRPDMPVAFDVTPVLGSARSDAPAGSGPALRVQGSTFMGEVRVRAKANRTR